MNMPCEGARIVAAGDEAEAGSPPVATGSMVGLDVRDRAGDKLGRVEEIMVDVRDGRVAYAVVACGQFLGLGGRLVALPWQALELDRVRNCFVVDRPGDLLTSGSGDDAAPRGFWSRTG